MGRRIAVYGGTFDPLHEGHLQVAEAILDAFTLDRLLLAPAAVPPHKRGQVIGSPYHRMAMLALATADRPRIFISTIELESPARPYTIETLGKLQAIYPDGQLLFIMGGDSFREVTTWREYQRILTEYDVIVATRPGYPTAATEEEEGITGMAGHLAPELRSRVVNLLGGRRPSPEQLADRHIFLTDYVAVDVSATDVRQAAATGRSLSGMVPPAIAEYIAKYQLYRSLL